MGWKSPHRPVAHAGHPPASRIHTHHTASEARPELEGLKPKRRHRSPVTVVVSCCDSAPDRDWRLGKRSTLRRSSSGAQIPSLLCLNLLSPSSLPYLSAYTQLYLTYSPSIYILYYTLSPRSSIFSYTKTKTKNTCARHTILSAAKLASLQCLIRALGSSMGFN